MLHRPGLHVLILILACTGPGAAAGEAAPLNAVVVVMDGARFTETWGDPQHALVPHLAADLAPAGVMFTQCTNQGPTVTNPGHAAISTGRYHPDLDNRGKGLPAVPGFLQAWRDQTQAAASAAWVVTGKPKLEILAQCEDPAWQQRGLPSTDCGAVSANGRKGYRDDAGTIDATLEILRRHRPQALLINLSAVDGAGHSGDFEAYRTAIRQADAAIFRLWTYLQQTEGYAGRTLFVLTNDHGRHSDAPDGNAKAFKDHGCACEGCRHVLLFMAGPGLRQGAIDQTPCQTVDLAPTVAGFLGTPLPTAQGRRLDLPAASKP